MAKPRTLIIILGALLATVLLPNASAHAIDPMDRPICIRITDGNGQSHIECINLTAAGDDQQRAPGDDCEICGRYVALRADPALPADRAADLVHHVVSGLGLLDAGSTGQALGEFAAAGGPKLGLADAGRVLDGRFVADGDPGAVAGGQHLVAGFGLLTSDRKAALGEFERALAALAGRTQP